MHIIILYIILLFCQVEVLAVISRQLDCAATKFLFAPHKGIDCVYGQRCHNLRSRPHGNNGTLCLVS